MDERLVKIEEFLLELQSEGEFDPDELEEALYNLNQLKLEHRKKNKTPVPSFKKNFGVKNDFGLKLVGGLDEEI